jgi:hypothetical protein
VITFLKSSAIQRRKETGIVFERFGYCLFLRSLEMIPYLTGTTVKVIPTVSSKVIRIMINCYIDHIVVIRNM